MTNPVVKGYAEDAYLETSYLGGTVDDFFGMEVNRIIQSEAFQGMEVNRQITDYDIAYGMEINRASNGGLDENGMEINRVVASDDQFGMEVNRIITDSEKFNGMEINRETVGSKPMAMEIRRDFSIAHWGFGYLETPYLEAPYFVEGMRGQMGLEVKRIINFEKPIAMEVNRVIEDDKFLGMEVRRVIEDDKPMGMELARTIVFEEPIGMEVNRIITDSKKFIGMEVNRVIEDDKPMGMEIIRLSAKFVAMQTTFVLYNTDRLRILCDFPSRGLTGTNWTATNTAAGDFSPNNLNTDIVEQVYRSTTTGITLTCDTEIVQGVAVDTIGILNHNLTSSAIVTFESSDDPGFAPIRESVGISIDRINAYYIAPTFPNKQWRYRRLVISDSTNPDGFIQIGTIVFGTAAIFTKEDLIDEIIRRNRHFSDKVATEGFTNVSNDRALKRAIQISFDQLAFEQGDIDILFEIFENDRTSIKCLWIPDPRDPKRFATFGKLTALPDERHKKMGPNEADTVSLSIEIDESL